MSRFHGLRAYFAAAGLVGLAALAGSTLVDPASAQERRIARPNNPASVTVELPPVPAPDQTRALDADPPAQAASDPYVSLEVTEYRPPRRGQVEAVVRLTDPATGGKTQEIGRFSFYPNEPFKAQDAAAVKKFQFKVDERTLQRGEGVRPPRITVDLVPAKGSRGRGARVEISRAAVIMVPVPAPPSDKLIATPNDPALVTAKPLAPPPPPETNDGSRSIDQTNQPQAVPGEAGSTYVSVDVMGYKPPTAGQVEAVVKLDDPATSEGPKEIGRFTIFPNEAFKVEDPLDARSFLFKVDQADLGQTPDQARLRVDLVPAQGQTGEGAQLDLGQATIEKR